jgi:hypothetical protein
MSKVTTTFEAVDSGMVATIQKIERETKSMKETTEKTEKQVDLSFAAMAKAGAGLAVGIGIVKGAFAAITGTLDKFGEALDMGGRLSDLSERTGETAGNLLLLERAFENSGVGADKVGTSINKLQKFMSDANNGTTKNIEALDQLGISYSTLAQLTPTEQMGLLAEKINGINSPTERAAMAMTIFGKSGGALLPFLQNFSGEISNAKDELGSMTGIMDAKSAVFDTVSDKIAIIKGKFMEFAAGILDRVAPALELFTTILSRIDAAALGQKLADAFIGGQKAMEGFGIALDMLKIGEFGLSWKIIFKSIELQVKETFNQIYKIAIATFEGIKGFIVSILGPNSAIINILEATFEMLGAKAGKAIISAVGVIIPGISERIKGALEVMDSRINDSKVEIKSALQDLTPKLADAGQAFGTSFDESFKSTKPLINTLNTAFELNTLKAEAAIKMAEKAASILSFDMKADVQKKSFDSLKDLKTELNVLAKTQPDPLDKMKKTTDQVSLKMEKIVEKVKELSLIEKLNAQLAEAKTAKESKIKPLEDQFKQQIEQNKFKQAENTIKKIAIKEQEAAIRIDEAGKKDRRSLFDIARDEGINTIGKSKEELRKEILEKRKKDKPEELKKETEKKEADKKEAEKKEAEKKEDPLLEMVKAIKELVAKIEPKLPTHALAL